MEGKWNGIERYTMEWLDLQAKTLKEKMEFLEWEDVDGIAVIQILEESRDNLIRDAFSSVTRMMKDLIMLGLYPNSECTKYYIADVSHSYDLVARSLTFDGIYKGQDFVDEGLTKMVTSNFQMIYETAIDRVDKLLDDGDHEKIPEKCPWTLEDLHQKGYRALMDQFIEKMNKDT